MNSRVSWSVDGIDPSVRERAEAAARRAGMSLSEWLNTTVGEPVAAPSRGSSDQAPAMPSQESRDVADIHQRLDAITRQIEQISPLKLRSEPAPRGDAFPRNDTAPPFRCGDAGDRAAQDKPGAPPAAADAPARRPADATISPADSTRCPADG